MHAVFPKLYCNLNQTNQTCLLLFFKPGSSSNKGNIFWGFLNVYIIVQFFFEWLKSLLTFSSENFLIAITTRNEVRFFHLKTSLKPHWQMICLPLIIKFIISIISISVYDSKNLFVQLTSLNVNQMQRSVDVLVTLYTGVKKRISNHLCFLFFNTICVLVSEIHSLNNFDHSTLFLEKLPQ